jgi:hypothetical protein
MDLQKSRGRAPALTFDTFSAALLFLAIAFAACLMPAQNDSWWHLRAGRDIVASASVPLHDSFSHTVNGGYWPDHEWLAQAIFYGIYRVGGLPLLTGFAAAIVTLTWLIVWRMTPGPVLVRVALTVPGVMLFARQWSLRPQLFTLLLLALTALLLARRRYALLPLVFVLWANLHGGVMLGVVVLGAVALMSVLADRRLFTRPAVAAVACALATGITPLGFSIWTEVPAALERSRSYGIAEWHAPTLADPGFAPLWLLAAGLLFLIAKTRAWRHLDKASHGVVWGAVALLPLALSSSRNTSAFVVLVVPALGAMLRSELHPMPRVRIERPRANAAILATAVLLAAAAVGFAWTSGAARLQWQPLSREIIAAIDSCPGQIYNRYDEGGYLIWFTPRQKVFIDSRQDPFPPELIREHLRVERSGDYEALFRRYSIRCAFVPADSIVARRLTAGLWHDRYRDPNWVVLAQ